MDRERKVGTWSAVQFRPLLGFGTDIEKAALSVGDFRVLTSTLLDTTMDSWWRCPWWYRIWTDEGRWILSQAFLEFWLEDGGPIRARYLNFASLYLCEASAVVRGVAPMVLFSFSTLLYFALMILVYALVVFLNPAGLGVSFPRGSRDRCSHLCTGPLGR